MWLTPIEVECRKTPDAGAMPQRLRLRERWIGIKDVRDRWYERGTHPEWPAADYFKVSGSDRHTYLIKHDLECDAWFKVRRW